jgi:hypothetical protein
MRSILFILALLLPVLGWADSPKCDSPNGWAASMTFVLLKNAGLADNSQLDFARTQVVLIASQKIGKDLYRQVHRVTYVRHDGTTIEAIAVNDASHVECSMTGVQVYVTSAHLSSDP